MLNQIISLLSTLDEQKLVIVYNFLQGLTGGDAHGNQGK